MDHVTELSQSITVVLYRNLGLWKEVLKQNQTLQAGLPRMAEQAAKDCGDQRKYYAETRALLDQLRTVRLVATRFSSTGTNVIAIGALQSEVDNRFELSSWYVSKEERGANSVRESAALVALTKAALDWLEQECKKRKCNAGFTVQLHEVYPELDEPLTQLGLARVRQQFDHWSTMVVGAEHVVSLASRRKAQPPREL